MPNDLQLSPWQAPQINLQGLPFLGILGGPCKIKLRTVARPKIKKEEREPNLIN